jgi:hypothetical protein
MLSYVLGNRQIFAAVIGVSWFWFLGSIYLAQLPNFTRFYLAGDESVVTLLLSLFSIGVGIGSLLCERLTGHRIDVAIVPLGAAGLTVFGLDLALTEPQAAVALLSAGEWLSSASAWRTVADVLLLGAMGGIYIVPLITVIQHRSEPSRRARVIAANNVLNALFMVLAAGLAILVLGGGYSIAWLFTLVATLNAALMVALLSVEPEYLRRLGAWLRGR